MRSNRGNRAKRVIAAILVCGGMVGSAAVVLVSTAQDQPRIVEPGSAGGAQAGVAGSRSAP